MRVALVAVLACSLAACGAEANSPAPGAISATDALYACVGADGHALMVRAYPPECPRGEVVSWRVSGLNNLPPPSP